MHTHPRASSIWGVVLAVSTTLVACGNRSVPTGDGKVPGKDSVNKKDSSVPPHTDLFVPTTPQKDVDILFVIDNSGDMAAEQQNLSKNIPKFLDALKSKKLNYRMPNFHIGIVTTDLGAGNYSLPSCEVSGGDGGKLQAIPKKAGCTPPKQPFISHVDGVTNIPSPAGTNPVDQVKQAFQCIAEVGSSGCGFEAQIEAARRALDPKLNRNPGFVRSNAALAVVFLTDEDDCSAQKPQLFDPNQNQINDPLGPLTSFRCFEFGVLCDCPGGSCKRTTVGARTNCKPAYNWLYRIDDYVNFFKGLKQPGRLIMMAIAGPTNKVEVRMDNQNPTLRPSCQAYVGSGRPAIRIEALVDGIKKSGNRAYFNEGIDYTQTQQVNVDICSTDYTPALRKLGRAILEVLGAV